MLRMSELIISAGLNVLLCTLVAWFAESRRRGQWNWFSISLLVTPLLALAPAIKVSKRT